MKVCK